MHGLKFQLNVLVDAIHLYHLALELLDIYHEGPFQFFALQCFSCESLLEQSFLMDRGFKLAQQLLIFMRKHVDLVLQSFDGHLQGEQLLVAH